MDRTAELRWFFRSAPPRPVVDWIEKTSDPLATRTDCYLLLPGTDALGVKVRGGTTRLELKLRARPPQPLGLPGGVTGQLEEWQRWSLPRPGITRLFPRMALPKEQWIEVTKQRRLTTVPYGNDAGCRVEFTALRARDQEWTTVGFESFGPDAGLVPALEAAAGELFGSIDLPGDLSADLSCGYPGWLATL